MEKEKGLKELKPIRWQGPDGAIHTVSVQKQIELAAAIKAHNETVEALRGGGTAKHGLRKPRA